MDGRAELWGFFGGADTRVTDLAESIIGSLIAAIRQGG